MRFATVLMLVLAFGLCASLAQADPNAPVDPRAAAFHNFPTGPGLTIVAETEPNDVCPGPQLLQCTDGVDPASIGVASEMDWYQIQIVSDGTLLTVATHAGATTPYVGDTKLWLYGPDCTTQLAYNDDYGGTLYSQVSATLAVGTYNILVTGYSSSNVGSYTITTDCQGVVVPPNDTCATALPWTRCSAGQAVGDLTFATNNYDPAIPGPSCTGYAAVGNDVVYVADLLLGDIVHLVYNDTYDGAIYIVTDCNNVSGTCVIGADTFPNPPGEVIDWTCTGTGTYYIIADAYSGAGPFTIDWSITCPAPGACCTPLGACTITMPYECPAPNFFHGEFVTCDPNPCPPGGACCAPTGACEILPADACDFVWHGEWVSCDPNPCPQPPPIGVCCTPTGECGLTTEQACQSPNVWHPEWTSCSPNPCPGGGTPVEKGTWGSIKNQYR